MPVSTSGSSERWSWDSFVRIACICWLDVPMSFVNEDSYLHSVSLKWYTVHLKRDRLACENTQCWLGMNAWILRTFLELFWFSSIFVDFRQTINVFLCITQLGFCCVYFVFVAVNLQEVVAHYFAYFDIRLYLLIMLIPMILLNFLKNLKYLTPVSLFASILTVTGIAITFHYMLHDLPHTSTRKGFSSWAQLPLYFGTAIYAFEGIGVVLPLENNMKRPQDFGGMTGVLNTGMVWHYWHILWFEEGNSYSFFYR